MAASRGQLGPGTSISPASSATPASTVTRVERPGQRAVALGQPLGRARARVDLEEAAVHGQAHDVAVGLLDLELAGHHVADERRVAVEHGEVALGGGQDDRAGAPGEERLLGRDDLHAEDAVGH